MGYRHVSAECVFGVMVFDRMEPIVDVDWKKVREHLLEFAKTEAYHENEDKIELFGEFEKYLEEKNFYEAIESESETDSEKAKRYSGYNYDGGYFDDPLREITEILGLELKRTEITEECSGGPAVFERVICADTEWFHEGGKIGIRATETSMIVINEFRRIFRIEIEPDIHAVGQYAKE